MDLLNYRKDTINRLINANISPDEAVAEVNLLFEHFLGISQIDLHINKKIVDLVKIDELNRNIDLRLNQRIPVQYLIGYSYFYGIKFAVSKAVLIPRKDTEILVETVLKKLKLLNIAEPVIADIGTGSGCISIAIAAYNEQARIVATDISEQALEIALRNAETNNLTNKISFVKTSLLDNINQSFDVIISNPPYIPISNADNLAREVSLHEPKQALFVEDDDILKYYREISLQSINKLKTGGYLVFEIDSPQNENIRELLDSHKWTNITTINDYNNLPRVICASIHQ